MISDTGFEYLGCLNFTININKQLTAVPPEDDDSLVISAKYVVRLAQSEEEVRAGQSLRYQVFNLELDEGLESSHDQQLDVDKYDPQCDHLLVIERKTEKVIGTYRIQTYDQAEQHHGFYTEDEFDLDELPAEMLEHSVELGRACIHQDHRNGRVLYLLWRGIAEYLKMKSSRYLLGCCSLSSTDPQQGWIVMDHLVHNQHMHATYRIKAKSAYQCPEVDRPADAWKETGLPQLFRLYLDLGATVLSYPALDAEFKTIDFLILVDTNKLDEQTRVLFFK